MVHAKCFQPAEALSPLHLILCTDCLYTIWEAWRSGCRRITHERLPGSKYNNWCKKKTKNASKEKFKTWQFVQRADSTFVSCEVLKGVSDRQCYPLHKCHFKDICKQSNPTISQVLCRMKCWSGLVLDNAIHLINPKGLSDRQCYPLNNVILKICVNNPIHPKAKFCLEHFPAE